ncbi:MAG: hypothetical protein WKG32_01905 [Gemmatimonadaceae bacterium]
MRLTHLALAMLLAVPVVGCGDDDGTGPQTQSAAGTYTLTSVTQGSSTCQVSGSATGCTINNTGANTIVVRSGTLALQQAGTFSFTASGTQNGTTQPFTPIAGSYTQTDTTVSFTIPTIPIPVSANFTNNNTLSFNLPGLIFNSTQTTIGAVFTKP